MEFPNIDPILFSIGPFAVRWYAIAYIAGIFISISYLKKFSHRFGITTNSKTMDDLLTYVIIGIILGGRLGYVLFYDLAKYLANPIDIVKTWEGGMSFHGGLIGCLIGIYLFAKHKKLEFFKLLDLISCIAPIGLLFGRIANFINGELWGRVTDSKFGIIFPYGGPLKRHPSQLYEAFFEGLLLLIIMNILLFKTELHKHKGKLFGIVLFLYGFMRFIIEFFREPDEHIGLFFNMISMGQILCLPMIMIGTYYVMARK